jgi:hypothetical protein
MILKNWKAIFIHVPKTGGGSLETSILRKYFDCEKMPYNHPERKKLLFLDGRWTQHDSIYQTINERKVNQEDYFKFCFVRNPWDRAVSEYFYLKTMKGCCCKENDIPENFEDWCRKGMPCSWEGHTEPQINFMIDKNKKNIMDFIGRFENLERDAQIILNKFEIKGKLPKFNANKNKRYHYSNYYSDYTRDLIKEKYSEDINYFSYKFEDNPSLRKKFYIEALKLNGKKYKNQDIENLKWSKNSELAKAIIPDKKIDFIFAGQLEKKNLKHYEKNRSWIFKYIKDNFTEYSYLEITKGKRVMKNSGELFNKIKNDLKHKLYNYTNYEDIKNTNERGGFSHIADKEYIKKLSMSKFCLCPAGDGPWSIRFYEAIALKSIPILEKKEHAFFHTDTKGSDYKFYLSSQKPVYIEEWADHNLKLFRKENLI